VEKGFENPPRGYLAGYLVVDMKCSVVDGSYPHVGSSEMSFKMSAGLAFFECLERARLRIGDLTAQHLERVKSGVEEVNRNERNQRHHDGHKVHVEGPRNTEGCDPRRRYSVGVGQRPAKQSS